MAYDWKTSKLVQANLMASKALDGLDSLRILLDHSAETYKMAIEVKRMSDDVYAIREKLDMMLMEYKNECKEE